MTKLIVWIGWDSGSGANSVLFVTEQIDFSLSQETAMELSLQNLCLVDLTDALFL